MFLQLLSSRNIAAWMILLFVGMFITNAYSANTETIHDLSETLTTTSLVYVVIFLFATIVSVLAYLAKRNIDGLDDEIQELKKSKKDYDDFKVEVAKTYISRETLRDLVTGPNERSHSEIKEMMREQNEYFNERITQLMDLAAKAIMGG